MSETIEYRGRKIEIWNDEDPMNPRTEWDNLGTMVCFHNGYDLGDENHGYDHNDYESWEELYNAIDKQEDALIILPLHLYDHSGIAMKVGSWVGKAHHAEWDSGQVGFIFISKEKVREEYSAKRISSKLANRIATYLEGEVETYTQYLEGSVYGYTTGDDSCGGYYGYDHEKSGLLDEAKSTIDHEIKAEIKERINKVKAFIKNSVPFQYRVLPKLI